jgi:hypothetical protein
MHSLTRWPEEFRSNAVGIVLSGAASDGTLGLKSIYSLALPTPQWGSRRDQYPLLIASVELSAPSWPDKRSFRARNIWRTLCSQQSATAAFRPNDLADSGGPGPDLATITRANGFGFHLLTTFASTNVL